MGGPEPEVVEEPVRAPPAIRRAEPGVGAPKGAITGAGNRATTRALRGQELSRAPGWYRSDEPLEPYAVFKAANPAGYAALDATAKQYVLRLNSDPTLETTGWRTQTEVPLVSLLRPTLAPYGRWLRSRTGCTRC